MRKQSCSNALLILIIMLFCHGNAYCANGDGLGMVTGSATGTYIKFGQDIATVADKNGVSVFVKESEGSLDNIRRLSSRENAAIAIVQSDLLGFINRSDDPAVNRLTKNIKLVFPFYNEEVHLLANKKIKKVEDLAGKKVVVGTVGSGNYLTANNLLKMLKISPSQRIELPPVDAVSEVLMGNVDAMFYVSGKPVNLFKNMEKIQNDSNPQYAKLIKNVHFVPLNAPKMLQEYTASTIGPGDYNWLDETIPTIAVQALLVSYDFSKYENPYYSMRCNQIARISVAVRQFIDELKKTGHPKWKEVELDQKTGAWEQDTCSRRQIQDLDDNSLLPNGKLQQTVEGYLTNIQ